MKRKAHNKVADLVAFGAPQQQIHAKRDTKCEGHTQVDGDTRQHTYIVTVIGAVAYAATHSAMLRACHEQAFVSSHNRQRCGTFWTDCG